jgi:hypothetical protein
MTGKRAGVTKIRRGNGRKGGNDIPGVLQSVLSYDLSSALRGEKDEGRTQLPWIS